MLNVMIIINIYPLVLTVENKMLNEDNANQYSKEVLERNLREVLTSFISTQVCLTNIYI
jgi:hypothetical protein